MPFITPCIKRHLRATRLHRGNALDTTSQIDIAFHYGRERGIILEDVDSDQLLLLSMLNGNYSFPEIVTQLQENNSQINAEDVTQMLDELAHFGLIEDLAVIPSSNLTATDLTRYESQMRFFSILDSTGRRRYEVQALLRQARITILGLGGLGSNVLLGLAALGVGFLRGVDFDTVELGNLNRQVLYQYRHLDQLKVTVAAEQIASFNPDVSFEPVQRRIENAEQISELIKDTDIVAMCADLPVEINNWMNRAALDTGIPFICGGYHGTVAEIGPFVVPFETSCLNCNYPERPYGDIPQELDWIKDISWLSHPNIHFVTSMAANLICSEIFKHITQLMIPATYNHIYGFDIEHFTLTSLPCPRSLYCASCGEHIKHLSITSTGTGRSEQQV